MNMSKKTVKTVKMMSRERTYSKYTCKAIQLLGKQIQLGRKQRKWTELELAKRAGISRATVQKIEKGDPGCVVGLMFEAATLVGVNLFESDLPSITMDIDRIKDKIALLPKSVRAVKREVFDEF
jgi:transcriptional regulator with XRE-family HTH domain